jgi:hypothetical protein
MRFRSFVNQSLLTLTAALALAAMLSVLTYAADPSSATWTKLSPSTSPTPRTFAAMAYDPVSKKMVLFGGLAQTYLNDTWTFDGTKWTHEKTPVGPSPRTGSSMAFDKRTKKLVMFGGFNGKPTHAGFLQDTWLWDGATSTWTQAKMKSSPPRATGAMLFTDPVNGEAVMFGGYFRFNPVPVYSTTWRWSGKAWQKLHPTTAGTAARYPRATSRGRRVRPGQSARTRAVNLTDKQGARLVARHDVPCLDDNYMCTNADPYYRQYNVLVHEFGHTIHMYGIPAFSGYIARITEAWANARARGIWDNSSYAMSDYLEYFAEGTTVWFNTSRHPSSSGGMNGCGRPAGGFCANETEARNWLREKDPLLFDALSYTYTNHRPSILTGLSVCP